MRHDGNEWTERELQTLRKLKAEGVTEALIAQRLGRSRGAISGKWKLISKEAREKMPLAKGLPAA